MPQPTRKVRSRLVEQPVRATALAPVDHPAAFGLTLPKFGKAVPTVIEHEHGKANLGIIARGLAETGILKPMHFRGHGLRAAIDTALQMLLTQHEARWSIFQNMLAFRYTDDLQGHYHRSCYMPDDDVKRRRGREHYVERTDSHHPVSAFVFETIKNRDDYFIGKVLMRIEDARKGQGQALLGLLEQGLHCSFGGCTPMTIYGMAQHHYWGGELDEKQVCEEFRDPNHRVDEKEAKENQKLTDAQIAEKYGVCTKKWLFGQYAPAEWALTCGNFRWGDKPDIPAFRTMPGDHSGRVLKAANRLSEFLRKVWPKYNTGGNHINQRGNVEWTTDIAEPVILRWHPKDPAIDIFDALAQDTANCGEEDTDNCGFILFDTRFPASVREACEKLLVLLECASLTDEFCSTLISDKRLAQVLVAPLDDHHAPFDALTNTPPNA